jgi:hypothetical protein
MPSLVAALKTFGIVCLASMWNLYIFSSTALVSGIAFKTVKAVGIAQERQVVNTTCPISISTSRGIHFGELVSVYWFY